jgi:hypothetical protein
MNSGSTPPFTRIAAAVKDRDHDYTIRPDAIVHRVVKAIYQSAPNVFVHAAVDLRPRAYPIHGVLNCAPKLSAKPRPLPLAPIDGLAEFPALLADGT